MHFSNALIWLENRVRSHNPNLASTNEACALLYNHVEELERILIEADAIVMKACRKSSPTDPQGVCRLTNTSIRIGKFVEDYLDLGERKWYTRIDLGNLLLSPLYGFGFIKILRDPDWNGNPNEAPYIIQRTKSTKAEPSCSPEAPIAGVSSLFQGHRRSLMKRWSRKDDKAFTELLERPFVKAADVVQATRWRINIDAYRVALKNRRELLPERVEVPEVEGPARKLALQHNSRRDANLAILQIAGKLRKQDGFYQYVDFDWRGRMYYCESFLNYQGNDLAKGLMEFYEAKELTDNGNYWLAVHTANSINMSYGIDEIPEWCEEDYAGFLREQGLEDISLDKMTLNDRAMWTRKHSEELALAGSLGLLIDDAEKPYAALACCMEWNNIFEHGDNTYQSRIPVPVDGSNNGWQHLGAMSKDTRTGELVGLVPKTIPNDFYVKCAQKLQELDKDWFDQRDMPMKAVRKGIAKRGAMTRAYSAGKTTIAENMYDDVWKEGYTSKYGITEEDCSRLAEGLVNAIAEVCPGPMKTMKYLQDLAAHVIESGEKYITWESPSGYPVKQEYYVAEDDDCLKTIWPVRGELHQQPIGFAKFVGGRKKSPGKKAIKGKIVGYTGRICHAAKVFNENRPDFRKIPSAISPNFVHSMDAAHMANVIVAWGGDFGAVHDSFSVHASGVEDLLQITKDEFVKMYDVDNYYDIMRQNILKDIEGFTEDAPELGTLNIKEVQDSDYFFA